MKTAVVYVHGLWMTGFEGALLRQRLAKGLDAYAPRFSYSSVRRDITSNARLFGQFLQKIPADTLHMVGHSLGGLLIHSFFQEFGVNVAPPGRVVLLGSPIGGSRAAGGLANWKLGRLIMGRGVSAELLVPRPRRWIAGRELGVIAGTKNLGLGRLVNSHYAPSDGTVYVDETRVAGMKQHIQLPVSHSAMPFSKSVAGQVASFLQDGRFHT